MNIPLANQISSRVRAKNFSVASLEKIAELKSHAVRNILRGKSKRPSVEVLLTVADVHGCSINELMVKEEIFENTGYSGDKQIMLNSDYSPSDLMEQAVKVVKGKIHQKEKKLRLRQFLDCVEEIYIHALYKDGGIDEGYEDRFIDLLEK
jgi:transcriptional regulator with XRE-family HTH domain